jgi:hypothetical protein
VYVCVWEGGGGSQHGRRPCDGVDHCTLHTFPDLQGWISGDQNAHNGLPTTVHPQPHRRREGTGSGPWGGGGGADTMSPKGRCQPRVKLHGSKRRATVLTRASFRAMRTSFQNRRSGL